MSHRTHYRSYRGGKIVRTVLWCIVSCSCLQWYAQANSSNSHKRLLIEVYVLLGLHTVSVRVLWNGCCICCLSVCLAWGADLQYTQWMPLPLTVSCFSKSRLVLTFLVLSFWYLLTRVDPDIFQTSSKTVVCVVCLSVSHQILKTKRVRCTISSPL